MRRMSTMRKLYHCLELYFTTFLLDKTWCWNVIDFSANQSILWGRCLCVFYRNANKPNETPQNRPSGTRNAVSADTYTTLQDIGESTSHTYASLQPRHDIRSDQRINTANATYETLQNTEDGMRTYATCTIQPSDVASVTVDARDYENCKIYVNSN